jgi:hypothetical protein
VNEARGLTAAHTMSELPIDRCPISLLWIQEQLLNATPTFMSSVHLELCLATSQALKWLPSSVSSRTPSRNYINLKLILAHDWLDMLPSQCQLRSQSNRNFPNFHFSLVGSTISQPKLFFFISIRSFINAFRQNLCWVSSILY